MTWSSRRGGWKARKTILFDLDASRKQGRVHLGLYSMTNTHKKLPELGHVDPVVGDEEAPLDSIYSC
jgi:hypothetical protein